MRTSGVIGLGNAAFIVRQSWASAGPQLGESVEKSPRERQDPAPTIPLCASTEEANAAIWTGILGVAKHLGKREPLPVERRPSVVQLRKGAAETPVYFIGAGLGEFHLAQLICSERSIFAVEVPWPSAWRIAATKKILPPYRLWNNWSRTYVAALSVHACSSPCVLAGISFNGLMAFEAAHQLNEQGGKVEMVILLDTQAKYPAPHQVAWQKLQKDWTRELNQRSTDRTSQTIASRLGGSWSIIQWMLAKGNEAVGAPRSYRR